MLTDRDKLLALVNNISSEEEADLVLSLINEVDYQETNVEPLSKFKKGHPKQEEFINATEDFVIALCGNRFGKTFAMAYKLAAIATGKMPGARHQPHPSRVLRVWFIGETFTSLNDTVYRDLVGFLRKDQFKTLKKGPDVHKITIYADNGGLTEVLFKTSNADPDTFESAKLHYIFVDEGISPDIFKALGMRMAGCNGQFMQCYTRLAYNYITEMSQGRGEFAPLVKDGYVKFIHGSQDDNPFLTDEEKARNKIMLANDEFQYKARIMGIVDRPEGAVFMFQDTKSDEKYNIFEFAELVPLLSEGSWYLLHDYGFRDPTVWLLVFIHHPTGSAYFVDEVYKSGLGINQSAALCYDMLTRWGCYSDVKLCIADKQIKDERASDHATATNLLAQYMAATVEEGTMKVPAFPAQMGWIAKQKYKNNQVQSLQLVNTLLSSDNDYTVGKPWYRFSVRCRNTIREIKSLSWKDANEVNTSNNKEFTMGDTHAVDCIRYLSMFRTNITLFNNRGTLSGTEDKYNVYMGRSRGSYFKF